MKRFPLLLIALVVGGSLVSVLLHANSERAAEARGLEARGNYLSSVLVHYPGHDLWKGNSVLIDALVSAGSGRSSLGGTGGHGYSDFVFRRQDNGLRAEVLSTMLKIMRRMDVFDGPQQMVVSPEQGLLASPDGWLLLTANWLEDDPRVTEDRKVLRVTYEVDFSPRRPAGEQQDLARLNWVTWSPPLPNR